MSYKEQQKRLVIRFMLASFQNKHPVKEI